MSIPNSIIKKLDRSRFPIFRSPVQEEPLKLYNPNFSEAEKAQISEILRLLFNHFFLDLYQLRSDELETFLEKIEHPILTDRKLAVSTYIGKHIRPILKKEADFKEFAAKIDLRLVPRLTVSELLELETPINKHLIFQSESQPETPRITPAKDTKKEKNTAKRKEEEQGSRRKIDYHFIAQLAKLSERETEEFLDHYQGQVLDEKNSKEVFSSKIDLLKLKKINYLRDLLELTDADREISSIIFKSIKATSLIELARDSGLNWKQILAHGFGNNYPERKLEKMADLLDQKLAGLFPTAYILPRVKSKSALLKKFVNNNPGFNFFTAKMSSQDLNKYNWSGIAQKNRPTVQSEVKGYQRVRKLITDIRHIPVLIDAGYTSAAQILAEGRKKFLEDIPLPRRLARKIYRRAQDIANEALSVLNLELERRRNAALGFINSSANAQGQDDIDFQDLFGNLNFCECSQCNSVLSPAAYFVDLLQYLKSSSPPAYQELKRRRSDLWHIPLNCDQTNRTVPYLELVVEVMGSFMIQLPNTPNNVNDVLYLPGLNPELPYEPDAQNTHLLAKSLDTSLFEIYSRMGVQDMDLLLREHLGLGPETWKWVIAPNPLLPNTSPDIYPADQFRKYFNLKHEELKDLVRSNVGKHLSLSAVRLGIQNYQEQVLINGINTPKARATYLKNVFKFIRLFRHLDYPMAELDLYLNLATNGNSELNRTSLQGLSVLLYFKDRFGLTISELTVFVNGYTDLEFQGQLDPEDQLTYSQILLLLGTNQADLEILIDAFRSNLTFQSKKLALTEANLTLLKRNILWAGGAGFTIKEWVNFLEFHKLKNDLVKHRWVQLTFQILNYQQRGIPVDLVAFYLLGISNENWSYAVNDPEMVQWLDSLREHLSASSVPEDLVPLVADLFATEDLIIDLLLNKVGAFGKELLKEIRFLLDENEEVKPELGKFKAIRKFLNLLDKNIQLLGFYQVNGEALNYFLNHLTTLGVNKKSTESFLEGLYYFSQWLKGLKHDLSLFEFLFTPGAPSGKIPENIISACKSKLGISPTTIVALSETFEWLPLELKQQKLFFTAIDICRDLHWTPRQLGELMNIQGVEQTPRRYYRQVASFFENSLELSDKTSTKVQDIRKEISNELLATKRDALVALLQVLRPVKLGNPAKIYEYFLMDAEMSTCAEISPIKAGLLSVQLFVQRCLMNQEENENGVKLTFDDAAKEEWEWRKNYRVWEANRKVFLFPENYLDPDLRDNKTPIYEELEGDLQQRDLSLPAVEKVYRKYLKQFSLVAKLTMAGSFFDPGNRLYYYFGRTENKPYQYFYRTYRRSSRAWSPWQEININIESEYLAGVSLYGRIYLFWKDTELHSKSRFNNGTQTTVKYMKHVLRYSFQEEDNSWSSPVLIDDNLIGEITVQSGGAPPGFEPKLNVPQLFDNYLRITRNNDEVEVTFARDIQLPSDSPQIQQTEESKFLIDISANRYLRHETVSTEDSVGLNAYATVTADGIKLFAPDMNFSEYFRNNAKLPIATANKAPIITSDRAIYLLNGQDSSNYTIQNGEKNYQYLFYNGGLYPLNSFVVTELSEIVFVQGLDEFLSPTTQKQVTETTNLTLNRQLIGAPSKIFLPEQGLDFNGPNGIYFREMYFHIPFTLAKYYNLNQKFKEADFWFKKIFDPSVQYGDQQQYWQYTPFRQDMQEQVQTILQDTAALQQYHRNPFNPHAIARLRTGAYPKTVVMAYIDNLLDWGDHLFAQDTFESINEAMMLYIIAWQLLGERPRSVLTCHSANEQKTFAEIEQSLGEGTEILIEVETQLSNAEIGAAINRLDDSGQSSTTYTDPNLSQSFISELFCIPWNDHLLQYWDRVEDRMYKIRNCRNIEGVFRTLPLFEPPIDPNLLIRAKASGLNLEQLATSGKLLPYRFTYLVEKARDYVSVAQQFGQSMLATLEKEDGEALAELRGIHESNLLEMITFSKEKQLEELELEAQRLTVDHEKINLNIQHYENLLSGAISGGFQKADQRFKRSADLIKGAKILNLLGSALYLLPQLGAPTAMTFGGKQLGKAGDKAKEASLSIADYLGFVGQLVEKAQNHRIRTMGWELAHEESKMNLEANQLAQLMIELKQAMAQRELGVHQEKIRQSQEVLEYYEEKMSSQALYHQLNGHLTRLYRNTYHLALQTALNAQAAFQFEMNNSDVFITTDTWATVNKGLLATEKLQFQLMQMERSYLEKRQRQAEIRTHISLALLAPEAILELKNTGRCQFDIPEIWFDVQYPGQYRRKIRSVSLTIPCVTGPYVNVACKLALTDSQIRMEADRTADLLTLPPLPAGNNRIFTSSAQNDSGLLEFSFRDERYLPFEGAGVISAWKLQLPQQMRAFNYHTISDVILHINYTADYDEVLREHVETNLVQQLNQLNDEGGLVKVISLKREFPNEWNHAISQNASMQVTVNQNYFPLFVQTYNLRVDNIALEAIDPQASQSEVSFNASVTGAVGPLPIDLEINIPAEEQELDLFLVLRYKL